VTAHVTCFHEEEEEKGGGGAREGEERGREKES